MFKSVFLDVICAKHPYNLTILIDDCVLVKKPKTNQFLSKFHFCTNKKKFKIIAKRGDQTVFKTIFLSSGACQKVCTKISFGASIVQNALNRILLIDANYGLPVEKATLFFKK